MPSDLFGAPAPVRAQLIVNLWDEGTRLDWDLLVTNPETGDILHMSAHPARPISKLGPELSRMLLALEAEIRDGAQPQPGG